MNHPAVITLLLCLASTAILSTGIAIGTLICQIIVTHPPGPNPSQQQHHQ